VMVCFVFSLCESSSINNHGGLNVKSFICFDWK